MTQGAHDGGGPEAELGRLCASVPELREALGRVLDRRERGGKVPGRLTLEASPACAAALRTALSARAVNAVGPGKVRLDLTRADQLLRNRGGLDAVLYAALGRAPRDPAAEEAARRGDLTATLLAAESQAQTEAARSWLAAQRRDVAAGRGDLYALCRERGADAAAAEAGLLATCIDAALANQGPIRLANFAARVLRDSKGLLPGSERLRRLGQALYEHDDATRFEVHYPGEPTSDREAYFRALEAHGITRDEGALSVLCYGPLIYRKDGQLFDHVARHATLGDSCRLTLQQLRGAEIAELSVERVTIIENRTPFLDYVEALAADAARPREMVVASEGQAGWTAVTLLRLVAAHTRRLEVRHCGDLDRSGVLILRSLARRTGLRIIPLHMDVATHQRFHTRGRQASAEEKQRTRSLVTTDQATDACHELLREIDRTGVWIEQEAFFADVMPPPHGS